MFWAYNGMEIVAPYGVAMASGLLFLEFAGRAFQRDHLLGLWIFVGALVAGTGIWASHFLGPAPSALPAEAAHDVARTLLAWLLVAVFTAATLWLISRLRAATPGRILGVLVMAAVSMGSGIAGMHYAGWLALRLNPAIAYDTSHVLISLAVAVAVTLLLVAVTAKWSVVRKPFDVFARCSAALLTGAALLHIHHTVVAGAVIAPQAVSETSVLLKPGWVVWPALASALILTVSALLCVYLHSHSIRRRRHAARQRRMEWDQSRGYTDPHTGLRNRTWLNRVLTMADRGDVQQLALVVIEPAAQLVPDRAILLPRWLKNRFPRAEAVALAPGVYGVLFEEISSSHARRIVLNTLAQWPEFEATSWKVGASSFPDEVARPLRLIPTARASAGLSSLNLSVAA